MFLSEYSFHHKVLQNLKMFILLMLLPVIGSAQTLSWEEIYNDLSSDYSNGRYEEGFQKTPRALKLVEDKFGKESENYAHTLTFRGHFANLTYRYEEAVTCYSQSLKIYTTLAGHNHNATATASVNLANVYKTLSRYTEAEKLYLDALAISKNTGGESIDYTTYAYYLGLLYESVFKFEKAEKIYKKNIEITVRLTGDSSETKGNMLFCLGNLYEKWLRYEDAEKIYKEALNIYFVAGGENHPFYASMLNYLGHLYHLNNNLSAAEEYYHKALDICGRTLGTRHEYYATYLNNLGNLFQRTGRSAEALKNYQQVAIIYSGIFGENHSHYATCLNNLAILYSESYDFKKADSLLTLVEKIYRNIYGTDHAYYAIAQYNIADLYFKNKDYKKAAYFFIKADEINRKVLGEYHPSVAKSKAGLGGCYLHSGKSGEAEQQLLSALNIYSKKSGLNHFDVAEVYYYLGRLYSLTGKSKEADKYFRLLQSNINYQVENIFPALSEKEKASYISSIRNYINVINTFYITTPEAGADNAGILINNQMLMKGILLNTSLSLKNNIQNSNNQELIELYHKWTEMKNHFGKACYMSAEELKVQEINLSELSDDINKTEKLLAQNSGQLAGYFTKDINWKKLQQKLKPGEAIADLIRTQVADTSELTDSVLYTFIIVKPTGIPEMVILKEGRKMESRYFSYYKNNIKLKLDDNDSYRNFWQPAEAKLTDVKRLYFSPDGIYNKININTLKNPSTKKYLLQELEVIYLSSAREMLKTLTVRQHTATSAGLFGYPDFNDRDIEDKLNITLTGTRVAGDLNRNIDRFLEQNEIAELEGTKKEIEEISRLFELKKIKTAVFLRKNASESNLKSQQSPSILHIATHGFFFDLNEKSSDNYSNDPLFRSGLILAGVKSKIRKSNNEDGILTAYEAMNLNLSNTLLVGLSACETGLGDIHNGEGVYGLRRAFQIAGARHLLMSLWKVDDEATQLLMVAFYRNWISSGNIHQSFRKAQEEIMANYSHPYYWGAFQLSGI